MTEFVEVKGIDMPAVDKIGAVQYVGYIESPKTFQERYGAKLFQLFPNGTTKKALAGTHCIFSIGDTPKQAWEKATQNKALMSEYGVIL